MTDTTQFILSDHISRMDTSYPEIIINVEEDKNFHKVETSITIESLNAFAKTNTTYLSKFDMKALINHMSQKLNKSFRAFMVDVMDEWCNQSVEDVLKRSIYDFMNHELPTLKLRRLPDIRNTYMAFDAFIRPRSRVDHDVQSLYSNYQCCRDQIMENPNIVRSINVVECLFKFKSTNVWYDTSSGYDRNKFNELLIKFENLLRYIKSA